MSYAVPVMAPDACHFAAPEATTRWDGDRLVVSRSLARQAGICAQAMTRVVFEGEIRLPRRPLAALSAEVLGPGGEPVETVRFDRAAACR
ncbi:MAG: hypothetical protein VX463_07135 [Pseudomonadota bacterium]|nr:hypothetical protein [Pseudomonadota bacterium]